MADQQSQTDLLIPNQQTLIHFGTPARGGSSSRTYKVVGITLLACLLIAGQALTAYFVLSQKGDIKSLQEHNDNLMEDPSARRAAAVPVKMHAPMNIMPKLTDDFTEESSSEAPNSGLDTATQCQLEATGRKAVSLPMFRPRCDDKGNYLPYQCWVNRQCWCVNSAGIEIPGTLVIGRADCSGGPLTAVALGEEPEPNLMLSV